MILSEIFLLSFLITLCLIISSGENKHLMGKCFPISFACYSGTLCDTQLPVQENRPFLYKCHILCRKYAEFIYSQLKEYS